MPRNGQRGRKEKRARKRDSARSTATLSYLKRMVRREQPKKSVGVASKHSHKPLSMPVNGWRHRYKQAMRHAVAAPDAVMETEDSQKFLNELEIRRRSRKPKITGKNSFECKWRGERKKNVPKTWERPRLSAAGAPPPPQERLVQQHERTETERSIPSGPVRLRSFFRHEAARLKIRLERHGAPSPLQAQRFLDVLGAKMSSALRDTEAPPSVGLRVKRYVLEMSGWDVARPASESAGVDTNALCRVLKTLGSEASVAKRE